MLTCMKQAEGSSRLFLEKLTVFNQVQTCYLSVRLIERWIWILPCLVELICLSLSHSPINNPEWKFSKDMQSSSVKMTFPPLLAKLKGSRAETSVTFAKVWINQFRRWEAMGIQTNPSIDHPKTTTNQGISLSAKRPPWYAISLI